jgi:hypothetical protein
LKPASQLRRIERVPISFSSTGFKGTKLYISGSSPKSVIPPEDLRIQAPPGS